MKRSVVALVLGICGSGFAAPTYHIHPLDFNGALQSMNSSGDMAGYSNTFDQPQGEVTIGGINHVLQPFTGDSASIAYQLNDQGTVVGGSRGTGGERAFVYSGGVVTALTPLLGGTYDTAYGINNAGLIVGKSESATGTYACLWENGVPRSLGTLPGDVGSDARQINANGDVVGESISSNGKTNPVIFANGKLIKIPGLPGDDTITLGYQINNSDMVLGAYTPNMGFGPQGVFLFDGHKTVSLGWPAADAIMFPTGLNDRGQAVGWSQGSIAEGYIGWLYTDGAMYNFQNLLDSSSSGWTTGWIMGIDNAGDVYGFGNKGAFFATPVPEPKMGLGFLIGFGAICSWKPLRKMKLRKSPI